jgi:hypothetical protein
MQLLAMSQNWSSRRRFLGVASSALAVGLAGCNASSSTQTPDPSSTDSDTETETSSDTDNGTEFTPASDNASISFVTPSDGQTVSGGVSVVMASENFTIEKSGAVNENAGHFHILVDTDPVETGKPIPSDDQHIHFGDAATETVLDLEPGDHTLTLQVADGAHRAYDVTDTVEVPVEEASAQFTNVADGDTVSSPVSLNWETENYSLEKAGEITQSAGHAHLIVDADPVPVGDVIPSDEQHIHFGDGSASTDLELESGDHTLTLQMGNGHHLATPLTQTVNLTVE